jgi:hypothetical protein
MQAITYVKISELKPHPNNPRLIRDEAFQILCESISANPDYFETRPVLCDEDMVIFAGNMRFRAAKEIGLTEVPCSIFKGLTEERKQELMIRDNVSNGEYDPQLLAAHFGTDQLKKWGVDMSQFGVFDPKEQAPSSLTSSSPKDLKPTIKISFETVEELERAQPAIEQVVSMYKATLSVSAGEL